MYRKAIISDKLLISGNRVMKHEVQFCPINPEAQMTWEGQNNELRFHQFEQNSGLPFKRDMHDRKLPEGRTTNGFCLAQNCLKAELQTGQANA